MTRMAVTGGAGFVGRHLVPRLAEQHQVRCLIRGGSDLTPMPAGVETIHGDVRNPDTARSLLEGCEVVVHLAACRAGGADIVDEIVGGIRSVLAAAGHAGVRRLIYVSCLGADAASHSPFLAAKWKAETFVRGSGVPYTILRSSLVVGRGDGIVRPLADLVRRLPVVPIPGRGTRRVQPIDVRDLARCIQIGRRRQLPYHLRAGERAPERAEHQHPELLRATVLRPYRKPRGAASHVLPGHPRTQQHRLPAARRRRDDGHPRALVQPL